MVPKVKEIKVPKSLAVYYAIVKRMEYLKKSKMSFANSAKLFGKLSKQSKNLSQFERTHY